MGSDQNWVGKNNSKSLVSIYPVSNIHAKDVSSMINMSMEPSTSPPGEYEALDLGHCQVGRPYREHFTMTNHSTSTALRFEWPAPTPHITFSPQVMAKRVMP